MSSLARSFWGWRQDVLCRWQRLLQPGKFLFVLSRWLSCSLVFVSYSISWYALAPAIEDDTLYSGYGEDQGKEDFSNMQLQKRLRGVSSLITSLHFLLKLRFHFFGVSSTTALYVLDVSWMFRSRYTLTVDNVETHERLSSGFMVSKNNFKVLLSTIYTDEAVSLKVFFFSATQSSLREPQLWWQLRRSMDLTSRQQDGTT